MRLSHQARALRREEIVARLLDGETAKNVAERFDVTAGYVRVIAGRAGIALVRSKAAKTTSSRAFRTGKRKAQLAEFHALGMTQGQFVRATGIAGPTVSRWARELGLKFRKDTAGWKQRIDASKSRAGQMAVLYRDGYTLQQIGDQFGVTRERVRQLIGKYHRMNRTHGGQRRLAEDRKRRLHEKRNAECMSRLGCTWDQYREIIAIGRRLMRNGVSRERTPMGAFVGQRRNARRRGISWELNFWQWWTIWQESGHWEQRGRGQGYVMCRKGDVGPYAVGNVYIATAIHNVSTSKNKRSDLPTGVRQTKSGRYLAHRQFDGKMHHLGIFDTPELAYAAYLIAAPSHGEAA